MKSSLLITVVVVLHVAIIGSLFFAQGCSTTKQAAAPSPVPVLPPPAIEPPVYPLPPRTPVPPKPVKPEATRPAPAAQQETVEYIVKAGDSLSKIAVAHKVTSKQIAELNKISDPNKIRIGQKLIVPKRPGVVLHQPSKPAAPKTTAAGNEYIVQPGDTLGGIALRYKTKVSTLRELNKLDGDMIRVNQKLIVQEGSVAKEAAPVSAKPVEKPAEVKAVEGQPEAAPAAPPQPEAEDAIDAGMTFFPYEVQENEDLAMIARRFDVTLEELMKINNLTSQKLEKGQKLRIP